MGSPGAPRRASGDRLSAPVDHIETWPIGKLKSRADNPNLHSPEQIELIAKSWDRRGQTQLILVDGDKGPTFGEIIAGEGRLAAAKLRGLKNVRVGVAIGWPEEEKHAYRIIDNQLTRLSEWDGELLAAEVNDLDAAGYDVSLLAVDADLSLPPTQRAPRSITPRCPTCNRPMPKK
jgi:ParB-like chromosome segregation protein Spo0J